MAAFTYQNSPFHLDSFFLSNTSIKISDLLVVDGDIINNPIYFQLISDSLLHQEEISVNDDVVKLVQNGENIEPCISDKTKKSTDSSSIVVDLEGDRDQVNSVEKVSPLMEKKKRKNGDNGCCLNSAVNQSKDGNRAKAKKQKKCSQRNIEEKKRCEEDKKKKKDDMKVMEDDHQQTGYIHVRARRGQATDSHSLAERVRREKISERLKMLQGLVPGCEKVTGKAVMLDEIINYVQSLQLQVEMLSMKLASMNPFFNDFGVDLNACLFFKPVEKPINNNLASSSSSPLPSIHQGSMDPTATPSTTFADNLTTSFSSTTNNIIPLLENSVSFSSLQQKQQKLITDFPQGNEELLWNVGYHRNRFN